MLAIISVSFRRNNMDNKTSKWRDSMNNDYELKESGNSADNKLNHLYDGLLKDFGLSHNDCYVQINPSLFVINESIFRDENN